MVVALSSVAVTKILDFALVSSKDFPDIRETVEFGFTLNRVHDMIKTYLQTHPRDKYSQQSSIIQPVLLNGLVLFCELNDFGFNSSCSHLNFRRFFACFKQGVP